MAKANREEAIAITLKYEGGYTNHPSDPGGPTNWGITIHDARLYWKRDATAADVKAMPKSVAIEIYRQKYWAVMNCDDDPAGVDLVTFDYGVNSGVNRAKPTRAACQPKDMTTENAVVTWVKAICDKRLSFVRGLSTFSVFGKGWSSRIADVKARGVKMALQAQNLPAVVIKDKLHDEADVENTKAKANATAAAGVGGTATTTQIPAAPHHFDFFTLSTGGKIAAVTASIVIVSVIVSFIWHSFHGAQSANAYKAVANE